MFRSLKSKSFGFNLAEVLVAILFLTLALFALISVNVYSLRATQSNRGRQLANLIATTELGEVEARLKVDFHRAVAAPVHPSSQFAGYRLEVRDLGYENAARSLRRVQVLVYWEEKGARSYDLAATFYHY